MMQDMMKGQMMNMVPMMVMGGVISWYFSGFVTCTLRLLCVILIICLWLSRSRSVCLSVCLPTMDVLFSISLS